MGTFRRRNEKKRFMGLERRGHHVRVSLLLLLHQLLASNLQRDSKANLGRLLQEEKKS